MAYFLRQSVQFLKSFFQNFVSDCDSVADAQSQHRATTEVPASFRVPYVGHSVLINSHNGQTAPLVGRPRRDVCRNRSCFLRVHHPEKKRFSARKTKDVYFNSDFT